jgi:hypothetical protein
VKGIPISVHINSYLILHSCTYICIYICTQTYPYIYIVRQRDKITLVGLSEGTTRVLEEGKEKNVRGENTELFPLYINIA